MCEQWCCSMQMTSVFLLFFLDEDDEAERNTVPLAPLDSLFSDTDSLKPQKKKKAKKMKEGKMPKVKKRKKEVRCNSHTTAACHDPGHTAAWQEVQAPSFSILQITTCLTYLQPHERWIFGSRGANERQWTVTGFAEVVGSGVGLVATVNCGHRVLIWRKDWSMWCCRWWLLVEVTVGPGARRAVATGAWRQ